MPERIAINDKGRHLEGEHMDKPVALGEVTLGEGVDSWNTIIFLYNSALKEVRTKVEILKDRKSTRLNSSHSGQSRMPSSA